jgi:hypothetical protein
MKTLSKDFFFLQLGVRGGGLVNFFGIFEGESTHWADFDAFTALGTP